VFLADFNIGGGVRLELAAFDYDKGVTKAELITPYADIEGSGKLLQLLRQFWAN